MSHRGDFTHMERALHQEQPGFHQDQPGAHQEQSGTQEQSGAQQEKSDAQQEQSGAQQEKSGAQQEQSGATQTYSIPTADWGQKVQNNYDDTNYTDADWDAAEKVYDWDGEEGELGPEHPELEEVLFGHPDQRESQGIDFDAIDRIRVNQEGIERIVPIGSFKTAGLHPAMLQNVELMGYKTPTPIQRYSIPAIKLGYDLLAIAQTGSGKTAAYLIPIINYLMGKAKKLAAPRPTSEEANMGVRTRAEPLVVIIVPSRELAVQIFNEARKFCYRSMLRPCVVYGGCPTSMQLDNLRKGCDILVASPGRLVDFIERPHVLSLRRVKFMVIDEADEMLDMSWEEQFKKILCGGEQEEGNIRYMLFSATFPTPVRQLARQYLAESYIRIRVGRVGSTHENIKQDVVFVSHWDKKKTLMDYLCAMNPARTIIFVNSKRTADELDDLIFNLGLPCTSMHADRTQREREDAMRAFRSGTTPILIATGVTARGIDVRNVMHVINYDLPSVDHGGIQEYVHRIGRTGRIGQRGLAISFYNEGDEAIAELLTMTLMETGQTIPDFLQAFKPLETDVSKLKFECGSDEEESGGDTILWNFGKGEGGDGDGWGTTGDQSGGNDGWGAKTGQDGDNVTLNATAAQPGGNDGWGTNTGQAHGNVNTGQARGNGATTGQAGGNDGWGTSTGQARGNANTGQARGNGATTGQAGGNDGWGTSTGQARGNANTGQARGNGATTGQAGGNDGWGTNTGQAHGNVNTGQARGNGATTGQAGGNDGWGTNTGQAHGNANTGQARGNGPTTGQAGGNDGWGVSSGGDGGWAGNTESDQQYNW